MVVEAGVETVVDEMVGRWDQLEAAGGWVAFIAHPSGSGVRYPGGEVVKLPDFALRIVDLAEDGRVLFAHSHEHDANGLYLFDPATRATTQIAEYFEAAGFAGPEIWVSLGRYLFRPE